jgi:hypothetical protein
MPPKRRRLFGWALVWYFLIGIVTSVIGLTGLSRSASAVIALLASAVAFLPLIRAERQEREELKANGYQRETPPVSRKSLFLLTTLTALLWAGAAALMTFRQEFLVPVVPAVLTVLVVLRYRQWSRGQDPETGPE